MNWWVYMILTKKGKIYTGVSTDIERRFKQHKTGTGARYFRTDKPVRIIFTDGPYSRSEAQKIECAIKKLSASEKRKKCQEYNL